MKINIRRKCFFFISFKNTHLFALITSSLKYTKKEMERKKSNPGTHSDDGNPKRQQRRKNKKNNNNPEKTQDDPTLQTVDEEGGGGKTKTKKEKSKRKVQRKNATTMQPPPPHQAATTPPVATTPPIARTPPPGAAAAGAVVTGKNAQQPSHQQHAPTAVTGKGGGDEDTGGGAAPIPPTKVLGKNPVTLEVEAAMADFVKTMFAKGVAGLRKEFAQLKLYTSTNYKFDAFTRNTVRNRYKDVVCLDDSRVILTLNVPPESDYIHANNIKLEGLDRSYIATQGPLETTIPDFWRLVHQESPSSIVMLCKCIEDGKHKCAQYFPSANEYKNYGCMFVNNKKTENTEDKLFIHSIEALPDGCSMSTTVKLFQMNDWPDRGVPDKPMSILRLLRALPTGRCIIHCSAGVGRTGTVILIDAILSRLLKGIICNVKEMFQILRNQRASAVQAESQYVLVHTCVLNYIRAKMPGKYKESAIQWAEEVKNAKMI